MAQLFKNNNGIVECTIENNNLINDRVVEVDTSIPEIRSQIAKFDQTVKASTDIILRDLKKASSFPVADILAMLQAHGTAKYLRVYNAITPNGDHISYLAPVSPTFTTFTEDNASPISVCCCQCNPCTFDKIINE